MIRTREDSHRVTFLVDPTMHGAQNAVPSDVYGTLDRVVRPDLHYHYSSPICAQRWLDVCNDPQYGHQDLLDRVDDVFPCLVEALLLDGADLSAVSLVSLGPGDGALDERMLRCLDAHVRLASYCGLDFSFELLRRAVHRIHGAGGFRRRFPIRAICGDFTDLAGVVPVNGTGSCTRVFSMTGFTLGNYQEHELLRQIGGLMGTGDYLFLDARLHTLGRRSSELRLTEAERHLMLGCYDLASVRRFVFGPVEVATLARAEDVVIGFDVTRAHTAVPSALNVLIYCEGLDTRMRLSGAPVHRDRLDLAVTTLYGYADLVSWLGSIGFSVVWHEDVDGVAMLLLKAL